MRTENSIRNSTYALVGQVVSLLTGFVMRTVFIYSLGDNYLGLNGLFSSVLSLLSLAEMGIGTAITFALYKPITENNQLQISALMNFYKKAYRVIALITACLGLMLTPLLNWITNDVSKVVPNLEFIYLLFLANTVLSYFFSYKRALITAYQMHYLNTINESIFMLIQYIVQIIVLIVLKNYIIYLLVQIICVFASNMIISHRANRLFPFAQEYKDERLDRNTLKQMKTNIVAMLYHRMSGFLVTGTDNLLIARISIQTIGLYSNYTLIIATIITILSQAFNAVTASVGNLIAAENKDKQYDTYENIVFINFWIYGFFTILLSRVVQPFISLWAGNERLLPTAVLIIILVNFFLNGMRLSNILIINAAGLFKQVRLKSFVEAIINLLFSLFFLVILDMKIYGVLLGTTVSIITTNLWWEPYAVYKYTFEKRISLYFVKYGIYTAAGLLAYIITAYACFFVKADGWMGLILIGIVCMIVPNIIFCVCFFKTKEFVYFKTLSKGLIKKIINKTMGISKEA